MPKFMTKSGEILTDEDFERMAEEAERGKYPGEPGEWIVRPQGRPKIADEELVTVAFKVTKSMRDALDESAAANSQTRSEFMRETLSKALV